MVTQMVHHEALTHIFSVKLSENTSQAHCQDKALQAIVGPYNQ